MESARVFLETVVGGGQHGGGVTVRTCDPNENHEILEYIGSICSRVVYIIISSFVVVKTSRLGHFVFVTL